MRKSGAYRHIEEDVRSAGFAHVEVAQPIPDRAEVWICSVSDAKGNDATSDVLRQREQPHAVAAQPGARRADVRTH